VRFERMVSGESVMTAQHDSKPGASAGEAEALDSNLAQGPISRRVMIRGAAAALPTILTLHSGAALARSSNLISATIEVDPTGPNRCVALADVKPAGSKYDLGEPPAARVTEFGSGHLYATDEGGLNRVTPLQICDNPNADYWVSTDLGGTWNAVNQVPPIERGFLVSATAWSSFSLNPTKLI
jgi:hypothetical protein